MCEALKELMKDEIEAARKEGWKERRSSGFPPSSLKSDMDAWAERMAYYGD